MANAQPVDGREPYIQILWGRDKIENNSVLSHLFEECNNSKSYLETDNRNRPGQVASEKLGLDTQRAAHSAPNVSSFVRIVCTLLYSVHLRAVQTLPYKQLHCCQQV